jgi:hypothetical protein
MSYLIDVLRRHRFAEDDRDQALVGSLMQKAVAIDIQNVSDYYATVPQSEWTINEDLPSSLPPFDCMILEYKIPKVVNEKGAIISQECGGKREALLVSTMAESLNQKRIAVQVFREITEGQVMMFPFVITYDVNKSDGFMVKKPDPHGGEPAYFRIVGSPKVLDELQASGEDAKKNLLNFTKPMLLAISFMNCKNVTRAVKRESIDTKTRRRHGKEPLIKIYTLKIDAIKAIIGKHTGNSEVLTQNALHICRGHFKDFSHGAGLFGKYKGRYWWPMTTRGSIEAGEVIKDYSVTV